MKHLLLFILISLLSSPSFSQDKETETEKTTQEVKTEGEKKTEKKSKKKKKEKTVTNAKIEGEIEGKGKPPREKVPYRFMFNLHGGIGLMNYFGDLRDKQSTTVNRVGSRAGYNFGIGANLTNWLDFNVDVLMASTQWNQNQSRSAQEGVVPRNFEAEIFTVGASLTYNFKNFIRNPQSITPFISIGISYSDYNVFTDLSRVDADGNTVTYNYWDNGLIYTVDQLSPDAPRQEPIQRDFEYETRLTEFPITAITIPIGAGFEFNASRKFAIKFGSYYYFTTTDNMDNVQGNAKGYNGLLGNDGFLYTSMSVFFKFDPFKKKAKKIDMPGQLYAGLGDIEEEDSDGDGVSDFFDKCGATPKGIEVNAKGCPADDDNDGIPNYRDKQLGTAPGRIVDPNGVAISYKEIYKSLEAGNGKKSLLRSDVNQEWVLSQADQDAKYTVHVGTYTNYDIPTQLKIKLSKMQGLIEHKVNDSISVFTVGTFDTFDEAEKKQNELIKDGVHEAFGVNDDYIPIVGQQIGVLDPKLRQQQPKGIQLDIEDVDVLTYGVELREYRLRIQLDKLSKLIAQHGVEMKTTDGGMKIYTIGSFSTLKEAEALQRQATGLGVKNPVITAKYNNKSIEIDEAKKIEEGN